MWILAASERLKIRRRGYEGGGGRVSLPGLGAGDGGGTAEGRLSGRDKRWIV